MTGVGKDSATVARQSFRKSQPTRHINAAMDVVNTLNTNATSQNLVTYIFEWNQVKGKIDFCVHAIVTC